MLLIFEVFYRKKKVAHPQRNGAPPYMYIYIYIYVCRERETEGGREGEREKDRERDINRLME